MPQLEGGTVAYLGCPRFEELETDCPLFFFVLFEAWGSSSTYTIAASFRTLPTVNLPSNVV